MSTNTDEIIFSNADGLFYNEEKVYNTGYIYLIHKKVTQKVIPWLTISARNNNSANAQYHGCIYEKGQGVDRDELAALGWHLKAAIHNKASLLYFGNAFYQGRKGGIPKGRHRALEWFFKYDASAHTLDNAKIKSDSQLSKQDKSKSITQLAREAQTILDLEYEKIKETENESRKRGNDTKRNKKHEKRQ